MKRTAKIPIEMLRADLTPISIDEEKLTMEAVVAVHGFEYTAFNWSLGDHIQKLDLHTGLDISRAADGAMPFLYDHEIDIGIVPEMSMDGDNLKATLQFSQHEELAVKLFKRYKERTIRKFSVGLAPSTLTLQRVDEGSGQKVYLAQNIKVFEVTATGMPRNPKTYVLGRQRAEALEYECTIIDGEPDPMKTIPAELVLHLTQLKIEHALSDEFFKELLEKENMTKGDYSELVLAHVKSRNAPPAAPAGASEQAPEGVNLSVDVVMYLQKMKSQHNFSDEFHMQLLATPRTKSEYSDLILDYLSAAQPRPPVTSHVQLVKAETDKIIPLVTEALVHRYAVTTPKVKLASDNKFASCSFMDSARYILGRNGYETLGQSNSQIYQLIQGREDFAAITQNFASRMLLEGYTSEEKSFLPFTRIRETPSFGRNIVARAARAPMPQKIINGIVPTGNLGPNEIEEYRAWAYSFLIALTREALIDDDLGQFGEEIWKYGAQVALFEANLVYSQILNNYIMMSDGQKLFSAAHKNFGKGEALDEEGLSTAREAIRAQLDRDGNRLNLIMRNIVVGSRLETAAEKYTYADVVPNSAAQVNPFARSIRRIVDTVLNDNDGVWFATTANTQTPIVELAYVKGQQGPYIMSDTDIRVDGRMFRYGIDVGVKVVDWRGIWINKIPTVPMKDPSAEGVAQPQAGSREIKEAGQ